MVGWDDRADRAAAWRPGRKGNSYNVRRSVNLGERVTSQLVLAPAEKGRPAGLLAGTVSGRMYCLNAETLARVWMNGDAAGAVQTRPLVAAGLIVFGAWDGHLHCLDASTGGQLWSWTENDNFYYSPAGCVPATDGANVFVCAPDGYVSVVELKTGKTVWRENHAAWESLGLSEDRKRLFIKGVRDELSVVDAGSGRLLRRRRRRAKRIPSPRCPSSRGAGSFMGPGTGTCT